MSPSPLQETDILRRTLTAADVIPRTMHAQRAVLRAIAFTAHEKAWDRLAALGDSAEAIHEAITLLEAVRGKIAGGFEVEGEEVRVNDPDGRDPDGPFRLAFESIGDAADLLLALLAYQVGHDMETKNSDYRPALQLQRASRHLHDAQGFAGRAWLPAAEP